jgi:UDP-glucose 4-epimerase
LQHESAQPHPGSAALLVTGAQVFIERHVCGHLAGSGARLCGIGHGNWPAAELLGSDVIHWVNGEVADANLGAVATAHGPLAALVPLAGGATVGASLSVPFEDFSRTCETMVRLLE